jgi:hypothetical protein
MTHWLRGTPTDSIADSVVEVQRPPRAYIVRKRRLPDTFTEQDWQRALDYWDHKCAVCGRPRGLWHTLAADHWVPLTSPECPGTVPTNIIPLCHGEGGCNNSKGKKMPDAWLKQKLGPKQASQKQLEIDTYIVWIKDQMTERLGCPKCGARVSYFEEEDSWLCNYCDAEWTTDEARTFQRCPVCQCWMYPSDDQYHCPRCSVYWPEQDLPPQEVCPDCGEGILQWMYEPGGPTCGWWQCLNCTREWVFEWI